MFKPINLTYNLLASLYSYIKYAVVLTQWPLEIGDVVFKFVVLNRNYKVKHSATYSKLLFEF